MIKLLALLTGAFLLVGILSQGQPPPRPPLSPVSPIYLPLVLR